MISSENENLKNFAPFSYLSLSNSVTALGLKRLHQIHTHKMHSFPHRCLSAYIQGHLDSNESEIILLIWNTRANNLHCVKDFHLPVTALFLSSNFKH